MFNRLGLSAVFLTLLFILGGCGSSPTAPHGSGSSVAPDVPSRISQGQADDITIYAVGLVGLVGMPYRYGGNTPDSGFGCSGLIGYIYQKRAGLAPPRTVARMQHWGQPVLSDNTRAGKSGLIN